MLLKTLNGGVMHNKLDEQTYTSEFESYHIYPTPPLGQDMTQDQFFKQSLTGLNSEFSFS